MFAFDMFTLYTPCVLGCLSLFDFNKSLLLIKKKKKKIIYTPKDACRERLLP